jgi:gliding motility-associated-like protein
MPKKCLFCIAVLLFVSLSVTAQQKQGAYWYFGYGAGLNFNSTPPSPDFAGQSASTFSCASICDASGNLLFYSDGLKVFNRNHQVMLNGLNMNSGGGNPGASMIVQKPGSPYLYYLFTIENGLYNTQNFRYSVVDMRLDRGKGGVVAATKNTLVFSTPVAFKLTACLHSNNADVWIVVHGYRFNNNFYSFLLSSNGISQPVVSAIGFNYNSGTPSGTLKSSPNSELIGDAICFERITQLLDFNRNTGVLTNPRTFTFPYSNLPWGIAFSPDVSKLYLNDQKDIYQYNLKAGSFTNVAASKTKINSNSNLFLLDMQLGMDGKIYALPEGTRPPLPNNPRNNSNLSVITCPNEADLSCGYQDTVLYLNRPGGANLPALNQTLFRNANIFQLIAAKPYLCIGDSVQLSAFGAGADQFTWLPANGLGAASGPEISVKPTVTTTYTVIGRGQCHTDTARVTVIVAPPAIANAGPDKVVCSGASVQLGAQSQPGLTYAWNSSPFLSDTTQANPTFTAVNATTSDQVYQLVLIIDGPGVSCGKRSDTVQVTVKPPVIANAGAAVSFCSGTSGQLTPLQFNAAYSYSWSPATGLNNANAFAPSLNLTNFSGQPDTILYTLTATAGACSATSQVEIVVLPDPKPVIIGAASVCPGSPQIRYAIQNHQPGNTYSWGVSGGTISQVFPDSIWVNWGAASAAANVWVVAHNGFSCVSDTVFFPVRINPLLLTEKPKGNSILCATDRQNQLYQIQRTYGSVYNWGIAGGTILSGQGSNQVQVNWPAPGQYKLWVRESVQTSLAQCFGVSDTLFITVLPSPDSTLAVQGFGAVCHQATATYNLAGAAGSTFQWQVTGGTITSGQGSNQVAVSWQMVGQGEIKVRETLPNSCTGNWRTLAVQVNPLPRPHLAGNDQFICPESIQKTYHVQGQTSSTFQWQANDGSIISGQGSSQITISWNPQAINHFLTVTETTAAGCSSVSDTLKLLYDQTNLELLVVGWDEAEENMIGQYQVKQAQHFPQNQIGIQVQPGFGQVWQPLGKTSITAARFIIPNATSDQRFRLQAINGCGSELLSIVHRPVNLKVSRKEETGEVNLNWNTYQGWSTGIRYEVWRQLEGQQTYQLLTSVSDTSLTLPTGRDSFRQRYRIKAISVGSLESWSNSGSVSFENKLVIPNIITPNGDGQNETFQISNLHLYPKSKLRIYNRWGKEVYQSNNYQGNWNAENQSAGIYYYLLQITNGESFKGWVEVVK